MSFTVEKSIPIPEGAGRRGPKPRYPWAKMKPGDSFFVPFEDAPKYARGSIYSSARHHGLRVSVAAEEGGYRAWLLGELEEVAA